MIHQIETRLISVSAIEMGHRRRQPSEAEVDQMANSIQQGGLLTAIGVRNTGDTLSLLYGATRLSAVQKLGWSEVQAVIYEGTTQELASAEIVENLERRHLHKDDLEQLTKEYVELRTKKFQSEPLEGLDDNLSHNSSQGPTTHAKTKVEGAKRGRPVTAKGKAKKEVAAKTGQSLRKVQRITSEKPKTPTPKKNPAGRDTARLSRMDDIGQRVCEISELLSACDRDDRNMIRKNNQPYLDGWFDDRGKLRSESVEQLPATGS